MRPLVNMADGRSPGSRVAALRAFPVSQWPLAKGSPLTVAGAAADRAGALLRSLLRPRREPSSPGLSRRSRVCQRLGAAGEAREAFMAGGRCRLTSGFPGGVALPASAQLRGFAAAPTRPAARTPAMRSGAPRSSTMASVTLGRGGGDQGSPASRFARRSGYAGDAYPEADRPLRAGHQLCDPGHGRDAAAASTPTAAQGARLQGNRSRRYV